MPEREVERRAAAVEEHDVEELSERMNGGEPRDDLVVEERLRGDVGDEPHEQDADRREHGRRGRPEGDVGAVEEAERDARAGGGKDPLCGVRLGGLGLGCGRRRRHPGGLYSACRTAKTSRPNRYTRAVRQKKVLVTGGCGFIPSNFIRHLLANTPYEVVSLDALTYAGNLENLRDIMGHERLSFVHGDIRDLELVREVVDDVDVVVNAAAESHVEKSIQEGASEFVKTNVEGTQILLDAMREATIDRFILISSSEVYGTAEAAPMTEEHPLNPRSPYAATKAGADRLAYATGSRTTCRS